MSSCNKNSIEIKPKTKELTNEELLSKQPFYNQPVKKTYRTKLSNQELLQVLPFYDDVGILKKNRGHLETILELMK